ncbi:MAG: murein biosynthesis integral membrane protein MurJ [Anaerolineales bacterium]|nr:murein biosynthesis integral membrane protein MurJ [Anaerolineales bacterium]
MRKEDYYATLILMVGLLAATLSGFLRQAALADQLGTGQGADIYLIAYSIPEFVIIALAIILPPAFIPLFADYRQRLGEVEAWHFAIRVGGFLCIVLLLGTAIAVIAAPLYLYFLAPGFSSIEFGQTVRAARIMMPAIVLMGSAILIGAALQVYRRFESTALTNFSYNITFVIVLIGAPLVWLVGRTALGVILGASAALIIQLPFLWKHRHSFNISKLIKRNPPVERKTRATSVRQFAYLSGPLAIGYAIHHIIWFVDRAMATTLGIGSVATLNYAYRLALVVGQMSGLAVSTAVFPRLSEQASAEDNSGLQSSLTDSLRFVWMIGLPATCALIILRWPLVQVLYEHGAFGQESTIAVSEVLIWYAIAVLADAMCQPLWRVIYAWRSVWTVSVVNGIQTTIRILINILLIRSFGYIGIAFSAMVGFSIQVVVLTWLAQRRLGNNFVIQWWRDARLIIIASIIASLVIGLLANQFLSAPAIVTLIVCGVFGGLSYLLVLGYLKNWRIIQSGI